MSLTDISYKVVSVVWLALIDISYKVVSVVRLALTDISYKVVSVVRLPLTDISYKVVSVVRLALTDISYKVVSMVWLASYHPNAVFHCQTALYRQTQTLLTTPQQIPLYYQHHSIIHIYCYATILCL